MAKVDYKDFYKIKSLKGELCKLKFIKEVIDLSLNPSTNILSIRVLDRKDNEIIRSVDLSPLLNNVSNVFKPEITVQNYNELLTITNQELFEFAEVINSQGTQYLPGSLGGTYYSSGLYYWNGSNWINDKDKIYEALNSFTNTFNNKREITSQKNSIVDDSGDLQLVNDEDSPGNDKVYGTNSVGQKGWHDKEGGGDQAFVNESVLYKTFADANPNINIPTSYTLLQYKNALAGDYDNTAFSPVANGVQLLKDLENVTIKASMFVELNENSKRISIGMAIAINGNISNIEGTGYIRGLQDHFEFTHQVTETFKNLSAGDVITIFGKRNGEASSLVEGVEDKGILSVFGFLPDTPGIITGFPDPIITSIEVEE